MIDRAIMFATVVRKKLIKMYRRLMRKKFPCLVCNSPNQVNERGFYETCNICGWVDEDEYEDYFDNPANSMTFVDAEKVWESGQAIYPDKYPR